MISIYIIDDIYLTNIPNFITLQNIDLKTQFKSNDSGFKAILQGLNL